MEPILDLDIDASTQYATLYADGRPVATFQRRRVYDKGPAWRVYDTDGKLIREFYLVHSAARMARNVAKILGLIDREI
jgi:hypothetical protein